MKQNVLLTIFSLLALVFGMFHLTDDIVRGFEKGGVSNLTIIPLAVVWLFATLVLAGRRSGYIIILLLSLLGTWVPYIHAGGAGMVGGRIANSSGKFFWVLTLLMLGVTSLFSAVLSARGLWHLPWRRRR